MIYEHDPSLDIYVKSALEKKVIGLVVLDVRGLTSIADYFIICSGRSNRQVRAVAESIQVDLKKKGIKPLSVEGQKEGHWVIMDYGYVIIHIFYEPVRALFDLESLWIDAKRIAIMNDKNFCMLIILDGWGISSNSEGNAVKLAKTPYLDRLKKEYPHTSLLCSGKAVGLPEGIMGNSEVGHLNIGAGRVVYQHLLRIDKSISCGEFFENNVLKSVISKVKANDSALHLMGLVSDAGVHSHLSHLLALLDMVKKEELKHVYIHAILDGRDTSPDSGADYIKSLQNHINKTGFGSIVSICGRYFAMDRDKRWDRIEKAYRLYTLGEGAEEKDPVEAVKNAYSRDETDEFVRPVVITDEHGKPPGIVQDGDGIIFFNFRADRARQITQALTDPEFTFFNRTSFPRLCDFVCMTIYDEKLPVPVAFPPVHMDEILGEVISKKGLKQLRIAETEKYAHVTYFFNGGEEKPFPLEDRCLIPSPRDIPTYDLKPEMSAFEVTEEVVSRLQSKNYNIIILNFANMDMVGHTGVLEAAIKACEAVDKCVEKVVSQAKARGGVVLVTADHGNAEKMTDTDGHIHTAHTLNPVPFILVDDKQQNVKLRSDGILGDIAPTILHIMDIDKPEQMTGSSLIRNGDEITSPSRRIDLGQICSISNHKS